MDSSKPATQPGPSIRDLYPQFDPTQLKEIEENLERYLEVVLRIYERIQADPQAYSQFRALTSSQHDATMEGKGRTE
jgi:hypothetical protein